MGTSVQAPVDVSYLADTVILLRQFEALGSVKKAISVVKKRTGMHSTTIREFTVTPRGIEIGATLQEFQGVLTGIPVFTGKTMPTLKQENGFKPHAFRR